MSATVTIRQLRRALILASFGREKAEAATLVAQAHHRELSRNIVEALSNEKRAGYKAGYEAASARWRLTLSENTKLADAGWSRYVERITREHTKAALACALWGILAGHLFL